MQPLPGKAEPSLAGPEELAGIDAAVNAAAADAVVIVRPAMPIIGILIRPRFILRVSKLGPATLPVNVFLPLPVAETETWNRSVGKYATLPINKARALKGNIVRPLNAYARRIAVIIDWMLLKNVMTEARPTTMVALRLAKPNFAETTSSRPANNAMTGTPRTMTVVPSTAKLNAAETTSGRPENNATTGIREAGTAVLRRVSSKILIAATESWKAEKLASRRE